MMMAFEWKVYVESLTTGISGYEFCKHASDVILKSILIKLKTVSNKWRHQINGKILLKQCKHKLKILLLVSNSLRSKTYDLDLAFQGH